jgi:hypothetical protein
MFELVTFRCLDCGEEITEDLRNPLPGVCLGCRYWRWRAGLLRADEINVAAGIDNVVSSVGGKGS